METKSGGMKTVLFWTAAFLPALVTLLAILRWRVGVPYYDSWKFVKQYHDWCGGNYGWSDLLDSYGAHPSAVGKIVYFAVLHFARGDVALLPMISWLLSLVISLGVLVLFRPLWRGHTGFGVGLMFLANLSIFSVIQGHAWIWDFTFQNYIPGACLVIGLLALNGPQVSAWRRASAVLLSLVSAFSFGTGFAVGFMLLPALGMSLEGRSRSWRVSVMLLWAAVFGIVGWLAFNTFGDARTISTAANDVLRPVASINYIIMMLGHTLGRGTAVDPIMLCTIWGSALLAVFLSCIWILVRSRDRRLIRRCWPWIAFCLWAMFNAAAICTGRFGALLETGLAHRYATFMLFMPLGTLMLSATVMQIQAAGKLGMWMRKLAPCALMLLLGAQTLNWISGWHAMELFHGRMASRSAALDFINILPANDSAFRNMFFTDAEAREARFLLDQGRLRDVVVARDAKVSSFRRNPDISSKWANMRLVTDEKGHDELRGECGLTKEMLDIPDLILITAATSDKEESVIALVPPEPPEDFFENSARRRKHHEHYFGWSWPVDRKLLPGGDVVTLRAYAYDGVKRKVRLISGEARILRK